MRIAVHAVAVEVAELIRHPVLDELRVAAKPVVDPCLFARRPEERPVVSNRIRKPEPFRRLVASIRIDRGEVRLPRGNPLRRKRPGLLERHNRRDEFADGELVSAGLRRHLPLLRARTGDRQHALQQRFLLRQPSRRDEPSEIRRKPGEPVFLHPDRLGLANILLHPRVIIGLDRDLRQVKVSDRGRVQREAGHRERGRQADT